MQAAEPIWIDEAGNAVPEITEGAGTLLAGQGQEIPDEDIKRYGLADGKAPAKKAAKPAEDKAVKPKSDKAVKPDKDK